MRLVLFFLLLSIFACKPENNSGPTEKSTQAENEVEKRNSIETKKPSSTNSNATALIDLDKLDLQLLENLVNQGINRVRNQKGIGSLKTNSSLLAAAKMQTEYQIDKNELSHFQENPKLSNVKDRINYFGGSFRSVAENVQYQGFMIRTTDNRTEIITSSYTEAANKIVEGWINSPGHYQNLINPSYNYTGTSIAYSHSKKALFATQVFGG